MSGGGRSRRTSGATARSSGQLRAGKAGTDDECAFHEEIDLAGVRADAVAGLKRHDVLTVALHGEGEYETAVCRIGNRIVGTLANIVGLDRLLACMRDGEHYTARVILIRGTHCRVLVDRVLK